MCNNMVARNVKECKKKRKIFVEISADSRALGINRSHLWRVLIGQRQSHSLLARYGALKQQKAKGMSETNPRFSQGAAPEAAAAHDPVDPAAANLSLEWFDICGKIGFTVVAVQAPYSPELFKNSGFEKALGSELTEAGLGHLDSIKWFNPIAFYFYLHTKNLAAGLQLIKSRLAAIGLLPQVKIGVADAESKTFRVYYPEVEKAGA